MARNAANVEKSNARDYTFLFIVSIFLFCYTLELNIAICIFVPSDMIGFVISFNVFTNFDIVYELLSTNQYCWNMVVLLQGPDLESSCALLSLNVPHKFMSVTEKIPIVLLVFFIIAVHNG